jgi:hypothetical protein
MSLPFTFSRWGKVGGVIGSEAEAEEIGKREVGRRKGKTEV